MKKIFITGEEGTIPSALKKIITNVRENEFELIDYPKKYKTYKSFEVRDFELDFTSEYFEACIKKDRPDIIIHSGAFVGTDYCQNYQAETARSNVYGTKNIVDICNKYDIKLVYLSTTAIFDINDYSKRTPITEKTNINPQTYYGITKYAAELIVKNECKTDKMIVRPVFGFSEFPHDLHSALTKAIYASVNNKPLTILLDKQIRKSYTHVKNIASAIIALISDERWHEEFNIGKHYKKANNWFELIDIIESFGVKFGDKIKFIPKLDYLHWHNIDNTKIRDYFNDDTFEQDIASVIQSVQNTNIKPYWL